MNTPLIKSRKRTYENDSPRQQRTYDQKKEIIDFYNSIKSEFGSKSKTVNKFDLKYVSVLNRILEKEEAMIELLDQNQLNPTRKRLRMGKNELIDTNLHKFMISVRDKNGEISTNDLQVKSLEIAVKLNIENFKGSKGYIHNWKKSRAQPMDMGIIHSLKSHYKNAMSKRKNDAINNKIQLNFSFLEAIHLLKDSWSNVTESTIVNCF
jgi:hypothetical protein